MSTPVLEDWVERLINPEFVLAASILQVSQSQIW